MLYLNLIILATILIFIKPTLSVPTPDDKPITPDPGSAVFKNFGNGLIYLKDDVRGSAFCHYLLPGDCEQAAQNLFDKTLYPNGWRQKGGHVAKWYCLLEYHCADFRVGPVSGYQLKQLGSARICGNIDFIHENVHCTVKINLCLQCKESHPMTRGTALAFEGNTIGDFISTKWG
ncbi:hypothetical protein MMC28_003780 [Mycoblastus sanguinarius]|nr:hypothetical protein [Mycoblastus sanguinarius]